MTRYILRGCQRCGGDLYVNYHDAGQGDWLCLQCGRHPRRRNSHEPNDGQNDTLLALDVSLGGTGWAVFHGTVPADTGVITPPPKGSNPPAARIAAIIDGLERLRVEWRPRLAAAGRPSGINWDVPSLTLLSDALHRWAADVNLPLAAYSPEEVRRALTGHPRPSRQMLAFVVMENLNLVGVDKTIHEWAAIAVGMHHFRQATERPDWLAGGDCEIPAVIA